MRNAIEAVEASRTIVLGRGIEEVESGQWVLSPDSVARAEVMTKYYHSRKELFRRMGVRIVCSGSHSGLALKQEAPPFGISEGRGIADVLIRNDIPHSLIEIDGKSISTFSNYEEIVKAEFFPPEMPFTSEDPLLVVTNDLHGKYRAIPIACATFGISPQERSIGLLKAEEESNLATIREAVGGVATMLAMSEVGLAPYSAEDLRLAGNRFAQFTEHPALLLPAIARRLKA